MHTYSVGVDGLHRDLAKVASHIGHQVAGGVAHLVQNLFRDGASMDQPARTCWLAQCESAVRLAVDHRVTHMRPVRHQMPVGEKAAGRLRAALDDMACQRAGGQAVPVVPGPLKLMGQHAHHHGAVHTATGDDHICPHGQSLCNALRAGIGVGRAQLLGRHLVGIHVLEALPA
ncbi:hypothetical protein D3C72_1114440 [compost metagenome]